MKTEAPNPNTVVWFQNRFVKLGEANVNILTHALNYGTGVFEGIRGYYSAQRKDLFLNRVAEHYERWKKNCGILRIHVPSRQTSCPKSRPNCAAATISAPISTCGRSRISRRRASA